jgi:hypothetical protein
MVTADWGKGAPGVGAGARIPAGTLGVGAVGDVNTVSSYCPAEGIVIVMGIATPGVYGVVGVLTVMALGVVSVP